MTTSSTTGKISNILRTVNYLGRSNFEHDPYFDGKIYNLKMTEADGDVILWYAPNMQFDFDYTGKEQAITLPIGTYKMETWGAQGGSTGDCIGGYGGYSHGSILFGNETSLFINVGGQGLGGLTWEYKTGGYNGGGVSTINSDRNSYNASGGGATHIATISGELYQLVDYKDTNNKFISEGYYSSNEIIIVSGGGGGFAHNRVYGCQTFVGSGGGYKGGSSGIYNGGSATSSAIGGTQTLGGLPYRNDIINENRNQAVFGIGAGGTSSYWGAGGGGGFFGGGASGYPTAGGSGYISNPYLKDKAMYCYDCEEYKNEANPIWRTISTTGTDSLRDTVSCPDGYSSNPISKCAKAGSGYARITYIKQ